MTPVQTEAASRVLIDNALSDSGWDPTNPAQVRFEQRAISGRADYVLLDSLGRTLCVIEAKSQDKDPYTAKEQARGYAENLKAPFVILSNGTEHWFWNLHRADERDAFPRGSGTPQPQEPEPAPAPDDRDHRRRLPA